MLKEQFSNFWVIVVRIGQKKYSVVLTLSIYLSTMLKEQLATSEIFM